MNKELLKVIAGLECCTDSKHDCSMCPYRGRNEMLCLVRLMYDALKILREVEQDGLY